MKITSYNLSIPGKIEMTFLNYGGIIQHLRVPGKNGLGDVVLGFDDPEDYKKDHPYFGALIGRYANRIAGARFECEGKLYELARNNGPNSLHGGLIGFDRVCWEVEKKNDYTCLLKHHSPHGHEGYPGELDVEVTYEVRADSELIITYTARTDRKTPVNFTNHSYFNLAGEKDVLDHELWINADHFTAVDGDFIPTGDIFPVKGAKDFTTLKSIGRDIEQLPGGYDHNYVLNQAPLRDPKARLIHRDSGRMMEVFTTEPGIQFYSGNFLDGSLMGKSGKRYFKYAGLCLETQHFPDSPHHPQFPSTWLSPGETFRSETIYKFRNL